MGYDVRAVFGADFPGGAGGGARGDFGNSRYYEKWYRRVGLLKPLVHSFSELRDIRHHENLLSPLATLCAEFRPDLIWERSYRLHCPGLATAKRFSRPYVLEWKDHLVDYRFSMFRSRALQMERRKNRETNAVVVESGVLRSQLAREGIAGENIIVAHNAVDAVVFSQEEGARTRVRNELGVGEGTILVGYLGSYAFYHDAIRLVLAANILRQRNLAGRIKILMVGSGKEYPECRKLAAEMGLLGNMLITNPAWQKTASRGFCQGWTSLSSQAQRTSSAL